MKEQDQMKKQDQMKEQDQMKKQGQMKELTWLLRELHVANIIPCEIDLSTSFKCGFIIEKKTRGILFFSLLYSLRRILSRV